MTDTPSEVLSRYRAQLLELTPGARLAMAGRMFATAKALALAGLQLEGEFVDASVREQLFGRLCEGDFDALEADRIVKCLRAG